MTKTDFMPIEKFYAMKATLERIWGKDTYADLKHCSDLKVWKKYLQRTLEAIKLAISDTVKVADPEWREGATGILDMGSKRLHDSTEFDDLFQVFAATLTELSFHQIGLCPVRNLSNRATLRKGDWNLSAYRSVQYVQSEEQKERLQRRNEQRRAATQ